MKFKVVDESFKKYAPKDPERMDVVMIDEKLLLKVIRGTKEVLKWLMKGIPFFHCMTQR